MLQMRYGETKAKKKKFWINKWYAFDLYLLASVIQTIYYSFNSI